MKPPNRSPKFRARDKGGIDHHMSTATETRRPAVAGTFYPDHPDALRAALAEAFGNEPRAGDNGAPVPKALIAPHAGYVYSGAAAAAGYRRLAAARAEIKRVVLIGPAHRVAVDGVAASGQGAFETPLGRIPVDRDGVETALSVDGVSVDDTAHRDEHSLEVHLPFLQTVLDRFAIVPLVVGQDDTGAAARVLDKLWGGSETLIVVSSDLSHYLSYDHAQSLDAATCAAILAYDGASIGRAQACGRAAIRGLLTVAGQKGLAVETAALCSSGDTAGPRDRVVGYGTWLFSTPDKPRARSVVGTATAGTDEARSRSILRRFRSPLLAMAATSIRRGLKVRAPAMPDVAQFPPPLLAPEATFVTLQHDNRLRGCIGSLIPRRPLIADVAANAFAAAFQDRRFKPLTAAEFTTVTIKISLLSRPTALPVDSEQDLVSKLRPGVDGLLLHHGAARGVFLPAVWESIREPAEFVRRLKAKAGLAPDLWSEAFRFERFIASEISSATHPTKPATGSPGRVVPVRRAGTR